MQSFINISVIVPFFNARQFIGRCADSLMRQSLKSGIEFIFVDDCSTDGGRQVLEETIASFPERNGQVRILTNTANMGSAFSREAGQNAARGEYLIHCDADDWVEPQIYESMLLHAEKTSADIVCTPFVEEMPDGKSRVVRFKSTTFPSINQTPLNTLHFSLCNKIIRRQIISGNDLHFFSGVDCWEDMGLVFRALIFSRITVILDIPYYHYVRNQGESLTSKSGKILADHLVFVEKMNEWFATQPQELSATYAPFIRNVKFTAKIKMLRGEHRDIERWKATFPETNTKIMQYRIIPLHYRILFYLANTLPLPLVKAAINLFRSMAGK